MDSRLVSHASSHSLPFPGKRALRSSCYVTMPPSSEDQEVAASIEEEEAAAVEAAPAMPQVEKSDSEGSPIPRKMKVWKTVTVVRKTVVEHDSDGIPKAGLDKEEYSKSAAVVKSGGQRKVVDKDGKKPKISESGSTESEKTLTESSKTGAKFNVSNKCDVKLTESMKIKSDSAVHSKTQGAEESEEGLLRYMDDFVAKNVKPFMSDNDGFYEYVKLDGESLKPQLMTKAMNYKRQYNRNNDKLRNGEVLKPREQKLYKLSKITWGSGGETSLTDGGGSVLAAKLNGQQKRAKKEHVVKDIENKENGPLSEIDETESGDVSFPRLVEVVRSKFDFGHGLNYELVIRGLSMIEKSKRVEMVKQWEILLRDENELNLRRLELLHEQGQLALHALKHSSH